MQRHAPGKIVKTQELYINCSLNFINKQTIQYLFYYDYVA